MFKLARLLAPTGLAVVALSVTACGSSESDDHASSPDELRADPSMTVSTTDASARLLAGYNAFLDHTTPMECVTQVAEQQPDVGDVRGTFYLRHVKTRQELAKELDVDVGVSLSAPAASGDVSTKLVKTFKQSSTTATFLVRAMRSYTVSNRSTIAMSDAAKLILVGGENGEPGGERGMQKFLQKCGGSYAKNVRYEAQVVALMTFETQTEESARKIGAALGAGSSQVVPLANARADIKTKAEEAARNEKAQLSLTVVASGFLTRGRAVGDVVEHSFESIDVLREDMATSFDADVAADRAGYFAHRGRNARPTFIGQSSYAELANAPAVDYTRLTSTLGRAEEFVRQLGPVQLRMETAYTDEVMRFLSDDSSQFRYNLVADPKIKTADLVPIAQKWAAKFGPDGTRQDGSLIEPLRMAIERCRGAAASGNYSACVTDQVIEGDKAAAEAALADYGRTGRIMKVSAWMPRLNTTLSYRNAEDECVAASMRLPKRSEMKTIAPAVTALAGPQGEVWFASDNECAKPFYANGASQGAYGCADTTLEGLPYVGDRMVVCVNRGGPLGALPAP